MHSIFALVVLGFGISALATPVAQNAPDALQRTSSGASTVNPDKNSAEDLTEKCFSISAAASNWYYAMAGGAWGSATGTFASTGGTLCVPTNNTAGGAMYIGPFANPGPGSTKLECFFPSSGQANCDASLVDGYSLSITCKAGSATIGGPTDLFTKHKCPDSQGPNCINTEGYSSNPDDVAAFFQEGRRDGNRYCIWHNCKQDYPFDVNTALSCDVTGY